MKGTQSPVWLRYGVAVLMVALVAILRTQFFRSLEPAHPFLLFHLQITLSALYGGFFPGLLATALSVIMAYYGPGSHPGVPWSHDELLGLSVFCFSGVIVSTVCGAMHRANRRRRIAEADLVEGRQRIAGVLDSAMDAIITVDSQQQIVMFNPAAERMFGYPSAEAIGTPLSRLIPERFRTAHEGHVRRFAKAGTTSRRMGALGQISGLRADRTEFPIEASISQVTVADGTFQTVILRDISQRQQAEEQLRLQSAALQSAANSIVITRNDGTILWVNDAFTGLTGYSSEEAVGQNTRILKSGEHPAEFYRGLWECILAGRVWQGEVINKRKEGSLYTEEMTIAPVKDDKGTVTHFIAIKQDVTKRKHMEAALATARDAAEAASRAKDAFLAALSHELRTPLTPALLLAGAMENSPEVPDPLRRDFAIISKNIQLEARLIDDLLDLTRITHGKLRLKLEDTDIHALLQQCAETLASDLRAKNISLTFNLDASGHCVRGDAVRLQQVFWNVIKNAIKFTPRDGKIVIRSRSGPAQDVLVEIADTGQGIAADDLPKIFEAFAQGSEASSPRFGGLGLGLSISRFIVAEHGGRIWAESAGLGKGAVFFIDLPALVAGEDGSKPVEHEPGPVPAGLRILLVEDDESTRVTLERLLQRRGHRIAVAATAGQARKLAADGEFDLFISDLGLPDGSGHDLMRELRRIKEVPAIALSGFGMDEDVFRSRTSGFGEHLTKPVDMAALDRAIARVMNER